MSIRIFQAGDEAAQVSIYNEAAATLPKFKPATLDDMRRRSRAGDFDPTSRFFAVVNGQPVGYATFHANGRVSFPWCRAGHEGQAEPLFTAVLEAMRSRRLPRAFAAYRADWPAQRAFFEGHGFRHVRDMVSFFVDLVELPTPAARPSSPIGPLRQEEVPAIFALCPEALRCGTPAELEAHLFRNPYFPPESVFALRSRTTGAPVAVGVMVENASYANPGQLDAAMPCFRLGAFGTEGMQTKRVNGLFSLLVPAGKDVNPFGLDLLGYAVRHLQQASLGTVAAQVPSDVPHLLRFYQQFFRRQGSFPVFECPL